MAAFVAFLRSLLTVLVVGLAAFTLLVATAPNDAQAPVQNQTQHVASTTMPVATTTPIKKPISTKTATSTKPAKPVTKPKTPVTTPVHDVNLTLNQAIQTFNDLASGQSTTTLSVNDRVRAALVNIICTTDTAGPFESISGSGVLIDPRGVILTNAHVAQFFLLHDYPRKNFVQCIIRTGSPARPQYTAELMFLPPTWIKDNAVKITQEAPSGTGEHDYALLRITGVVSPAVVYPSKFPFLLTSLYPPQTGNDVLQAGYAAGFLGGITVQNDLYASSAYTKVGEVYTYGPNTIDLFSLGGSVVAQHGSSGGPIANTDGTLVGVIVTSTTGEDTASRILRALSTSYIIEDFEKERGKPLASVLSSDDLVAEVDIFNRIFAPSERAALIAELEK